MIVAFNSEGNSVASFKDSSEVARLLDVQAYDVLRCIAGVRETVKGMVFRYVDSEDVITNYTLSVTSTKKGRKTTPVVLYRRTNLKQPVKVYTKIVDVARDIDVRPEIVSMHVRGKAHVGGLKGWMVKRVK